MNYNEFEPEENKNQEEIELYYIPENEKKPSKKRPFLNLKVFFRSLFSTLLIAILVIFAWRAGVFAVDYFSAKKDGMSSSEAFTYAWSGTVDFFAGIVDEVSPVMLTDKNILVIGSDQSKINADVIMLVQLDAKTKSVDVISVLRDTLIKYNGRNYKINAALHLGGEEFLVEQVEDVLNVKIDNYVFLSYDGFREIIDALGGVDFYVPQNMYYHDPEQNLLINLKEGQQHLDGNKAEQLVRFRQYPMGDIQRTQVQRDFLVALYKQKLNSDIVKNYKTIVPAVMEFLDTDIGIQDALQYVNFVSKFDINSISTYLMPGEPKYINNISYVIADPVEINNMFEEIERSHQKSEDETVPAATYRDDIVDENGETINQ